ncbi:hypothetical protein KEJ27_09510 [Candidatus Bathyarchaeota archaeon]|nr:hypothetical protein [Candidatus Bathyarchaeota archaeon]MBS7618054.1 hypothetical protein [Candidatus Bathyarchaeota archaeon]
MRLPLEAGSSGTVICQHILCRDGLQVEAYDSSASLLENCKPPHRPVDDESHNNMILRPEKTVDSPFWYSEQTSESE